MEKNFELPMENGGVLEAHISDGEVVVTDILKSPTDGVLDLSLKKGSRGYEFLREKKKAEDARWKQVLEEKQKAEDACWTQAYEDLCWTRSYEDSYIILGLSVSFAGNGKMYDGISSVRLSNAVSGFTADSCQFPNVSSVESSTFRFATTRISDVGFAGIVYSPCGTEYLLNVFKRRNDVSLYGIDGISTGAFESTDALLANAVSRSLKFFDKNRSVSRGLKKRDAVKDFAAYPLLFKKDKGGLYWFGNIVAGADKDVREMKIKRKDAYVLSAAADGILHFDIPDKVFIGLAEKAIAPPDKKKTVLLHITEKIGKEMEEEMGRKTMSSVSKIVSDCEDYTDEDGVLYTKDFKKLIVCPQNRDGECINIHDGTEIIAAHAFREVMADRIVMPDSVKFLESMAFTSCKMREIRLSRGLDSIESASPAMNGQFEDCIRLCEITIPEPVQYIGQKSFRHCSSLGKVIFEEGSAETIEERAFSVTPLREVSLPKSCRRVGKAAFESVYKITAYAYTAGVFGGAASYSSIPSELRHDLTLTLVREDGEKQSFFVPGEIRQTMDEGEYIDVAWREGGSDAAVIAERILETASCRFSTSQNTKLRCSLQALKYGSEDEKTMGYIKRYVEKYAEMLIDTGGTGATEELCQLIDYGFLNRRGVQKRLLEKAASSGNAEMATILAEKLGKGRKSAPKELKI